ncbi:MAG: hypothetical protein J6386_15485 [Candidatus Synoicihabitans palmerolidicus]|nr:hypothetical protein [Candidatus Synoicihabitans palmerolidicus]
MSSGPASPDIAARRLASLPGLLPRHLTTVRRYRDHPAVLMWGLGNEMEGDGTDPRVWRELETLAA